MASCTTHAHLFSIHSSFSVNSMRRCLPPARGLFVRARYLPCQRLHPRRHRLPNHSDCGRSLLFMSTSWSHRPFSSTPNPVPTRSPRSYMKDFYLKVHPDLFSDSELHRRVNQVPYTIHNTPVYLFQPRATTSRQDSLGALNALLDYAALLAEVATAVYTRQALTHTHTHTHSRQGGEEGRARGRSLLPAPRPETPPRLSDAFVLLQAGAEGGRHGGRWCVGGRREDRGDGGGYG